MGPPLPRRIADRCRVFFGSLGRFFDRRFLGGRRLFLRRLLGSRRLSNWSLVHRIVAFMIDAGWHDLANTFLAVSLGFLMFMLDNEWRGRPL